MIQRIPGVECTEESRALWRTRTQVRVRTRTRAGKNIRTLGRTTRRDWSCQGRMRIRSSRRRPRRRIKRWRTCRWSSHKFSPLSNPPFHPLLPPPYTPLLNHSLNPPRLHRRPRNPSRRSKSESSLPTTLHPLPRCTLRRSVYPLPPSLVLLNSPPKCPPSTRPLRLNLESQVSNPSSQTTPRALNLSSSQ